MKRLIATARNVKRCIYNSLIYTIYYKFALGCKVSMHLIVDYIHIHRISTINVLYLVYILVSHLNAIKTLDSLNYATT